MVSDTMMFLISLDYSEHRNTKILTILVKQWKKRTVAVLPMQIH